MSYFLEGDRNTLARRPAPFIVPASLSLIAHPPQVPRRPYRCGLINNPKPDANAASSHEPSQDLPTLLSHPSTQATSTTTPGKKTSTNVTGASKSTTRFTHLGDSTPLCQRNCSAHNSAIAAIPVPGLKINFQRHFLASQAIKVVGI